MMKNIARLTLGLALMVGASAANAQKIGVINTQEVLATLPEAQAANQRLQTIQKSYIDTLTNMQTKVQTTYETYSKILDQMNEDKKKAAQQELTTLQDNIVKYREAKLGQQGEYVQMQQQLLQPIFDKVKGAIDGFAKKEKFTVLLEKTNALFVDGSVDVTKKFEDYMKTVK